MEDDKPFVCMLPECGMRFANEDHLTVHRNKHEMLLQFTPTSSFKNLFSDQTPTPTRFLNALESELFQDLHNDNPFDATFRKANTLGGSNGQITMHESSTLIANLPDTEALNTPSFILTAEPDITTSTTKQPNIISLKTPVPTVEINNKALDEGSQTLPFTPHSQLTLTTEEENTCNSAIVTHNGDTPIAVPSSQTETSAPYTGIEIPSALVVGRQKIRNTVVQTPVITSVGHSGSLSKTSVTCVPTAVVVTRAVTNVVPTLSSSVSQVSVVSIPTSQPKITDTPQSSMQSVNAPVVQIIIKLPDGQSMPVQIPVVTIAPAPTINVPTVKTAANGVPNISPTQSLAKMKLKEVLKLAKKTVSSNNSMNENFMKEPLLQPVHIMPTQDSLDGSFNESPPSSPYSVHRPGSTGRRRRISEEDPDEKRMKSLERNRAAATRCRQKRKQWTQALEKKADELACTNVHLQNEVTMLRNEVTQLKTMLLAHKDCPVTQQQKASIFSEVTTVHTMPLQVTRVSLPIVTARASEAQQVSNLPLAELMEFEESSSRSGSVSDTSETSTRER